jgi:predicted small metal-binding protein
MIELPRFDGLSAAQRRGKESMTCGSMKVACEDGFEVVTKDKNELVAMTQWHVEHSHHKKVSEAEVMAMSKHP